MGRSPWLPPRSRRGPRPDRPGAPESKFLSLNSYHPPTEVARDGRKMRGSLSLRNVRWVLSLAICLILPAGVSGFDLPESDSQIWKVGLQRWTVQEENRYGEWVEANVNEDFFIRHGIPVDCADVPHAVRWIYARISHLPAAATTVDNRLMGHWSRDWGHLPTDERWDKDRRFRAALQFMLSKTWTRSLPSDLYPIRVAPDSVKAGTVLLIAESHAGIVRNIVMDGSTVHPVQTLEATAPRHMQKMKHRDFNLPDPGLPFHSGLVKFRWPIQLNGQWQYLQMKEHPYYSEEQYSSTFNDGSVDYIDAVAKRIDPKVYDPHERISRILDALTNRLKERIPIVLAGNQQCRRGRCPEGTRLWNDYSTPGRDESLAVAISYLEGFMKQNHIDREPLLDQTDRIFLQISPDRVITVKHVLQNAAWLSSDPEAAIAARWGFEKCSMIALNIRTAQDSIAFITRTYGRTDPRFAERSIWVRQRIVDEMEEEGRKSNCAKSSVQQVVSTNSWQMRD